MKRIERERERERERELFFCVQKLYIEWERKWQIYNKIMRIKRAKIKEDKGIEKEWYYGRD